MLTDRRHHQHESRPRGNGPTASQHIGRAVRALVGADLMGAFGKHPSTVNQTETPWPQSVGLRDDGRSRHRSEGAERRSDTMTVPIRELSLSAGQNHANGMPDRERELEGDRVKYGKAYLALQREREKRNMKEREERGTEKKRAERRHQIPTSHAQAVVSDSLLVHPSQTAPVIRPARRQLHRDIPDWLNHIPKDELPPDADPFFRPEVPRRVAFEDFNHATPPDPRKPIKDKDRKGRQDDAGETPHAARKLSKERRTDDRGRQRSNKKSKKTDYDRGKHGDKVKSLSRKVTHEKKVRDRSNAKQDRIPRENHHNHHHHHSHHHHHHHRHRSSERPSRSTSDPSTLWQRLGRPRRHHREEDRHKKDHHKSECHESHRRRH